MKPLFLCLMWALCYLLFSGSNTATAEAIRGKLPIAPGSEVRLYSMQMHQSTLLARAQTEKDSIFKIIVPANSYHGFYLVRWEGGETEVLYTGSPIGFQVDAQAQLTVVRGEPWLLYREKRAQLLQLRKRSVHLDSLVRATSADAFAYPKLQRKQKKAHKKLQKLQQNLVKAGESVWSRALLFEFAWLGYTPAAFAATYAPDSALQLVSLSDTLALYHNRWPHFMLLYVAAYAPVTLPNVDSALLACTQKLMAKTKQHPAYLASSLQFLQMGMQSFGATAAIQWIQREMNLLAFCADPAMADKQYLYVQKAKVGSSLPPLAVAKNGQPQLLVFWSAECMPCLQSLTDLHLWLKNNHPQLQVTALALNTDTMGWIAEKQALDGWTHLRLDQGWNSDVVRQLGISQVPFYCMVDANGRMVGLYEQTSALRSALER